MKLIPFVLGLMCAALAGCEQTTRVGSGCPDGVCPQASAREDDACTFRHMVAQAELGEESEPAFVSLCLPGALERREDGTIAAHVLYWLPDGEACADHAFLKRASEAVREQYQVGVLQAELCELEQLAVVMTEDGPMVEPGDGFYYDDFSDEAGEECSGRPRIYVPPSAAPWPGVTLSYEAIERLDSDGERDEALVCRPIRGTEPVGTSCLPPQHRTYSGFETVFQTRSEACGDGLCMVYHLDGDTDPSCEDDDSTPSCAEPDEVDYRAYCTCRCSGPSSTQNLCECPEEYSCVDIVPWNVPDMLGGYCVKNWPQDRPLTD